MDNESYFFVFWHMQLYMSWYIRSFSGFTFLNILYFFKYSCTNIFHRRSLYTFYTIYIYIYISHDIHVKTLSLFVVIQDNASNRVKFQGNKNIQTLHIVALKFMAYCDLFFLHQYSPYHAWYVRLQNDMDPISSHCFISNEKSFSHLEKLYINNVKALIAYPADDTGKNVFRNAEKWKHIPLQPKTIFAMQVQNFDSQFWQQADDILYSV